MPLISHLPCWFRASTPQWAVRQGTWYMQIQIPCRALETPEKKSREAVFFPENEKVLAVLIASDWRHCERQICIGAILSWLQCKECGWRKQRSCFFFCRPLSWSRCHLFPLGSVCAFQLLLTSPTFSSFPTPCFFLHLLLAHLYQSLPNMRRTSRRIHTIMPLGAFAQRLFAQMEVDCHNGKAITFFAIPHLKLHISTIFCATGTREEGSGV